MPETNTINDIGLQMQESIRRPECDDARLVAASVCEDIDEVIAYLRRTKKDIRALARKTKNPVHSEQDDVLVNTSDFEGFQDKVTAMLAGIIPTDNGPQVLVVREGEAGDGAVLRVILADQLPANLDELAAYGNQHIDTMNPDICHTAQEVQAIFDEMNPPATEEA